MSSVDDAEKNSAQKARRLTQMTNSRLRHLSSTMEKSSAVIGDLKDVRLPREVIEPRLKKRRQDHELLSRSYGDETLSPMLLVYCLRQGETYRLCTRYILIL
jgi:hypothetical protein